MIRTICSLLASFHSQGLAFGTRKHTMETYGGYAMHIVNGPPVATTSAWLIYA